MGLVTALAFFVCILLHELGHAIVARARGMHIGGITLFLFGGVSEITDEPPSAGTESSWPSPGRSSAWCWPSSSAFWPRSGTPAAGPGRSSCSSATWA
jgi:hypothetical protein